MKNLFIFGCSYSNDWVSVFKDVGAPNNKQGVYARQYKKENKRMPLHFQDILREEFNIDEVYNLAIGGASNYTILEEICKNFHSIQPNDYVFIEWSDVTRFRIIGKGYRGSDKWNTVYVSDDESFFQKQSVARDSELTHNEIDNWSNLLIKVLPKNTLFWTPFFQTHFHKIDNEYIENKLGYDCTITYESKGTVIDNHWGENAHQVVGDWLVDKFKNQNRLL
jgi:hypothetical protein